MPSNRGEEHHHGATTLFLENSPRLLSLSLVVCRPLPTTIEQQAQQQVFHSQPEGTCHGGGFLSEKLSEDSASCRRISSKRAMRLGMTPSIFFFLCVLLLVPSRSDSHLSTRSLSHPSVTEQPTTNPHTHTPSSKKKPSCLLPFLPN